MKRDARVCRRLVRKNRHTWLGGVGCISAFVRLGWTVYRPAPPSAGPASSKSSSDSDIQLSDMVKRAVIKLKRSKVRVFEVAIYRIFAVFKLICVFEKNGKNAKNITKSEKIPMGKFHTL